MKNLPHDDSDPNQNINRNRETEFQSNGESENQTKQRIRRNRDTDGTDDTDDSALAARVKTLQEAARLSLAVGIDGNSMFVFARALKAFEVTIGKIIEKKELGNALSVWWAAAAPHLTLDDNFDEYLLLLKDAYEKVKTPLGSNALEIALERAQDQPAPPEAESYSSPKIRRLVAVCYQLQEINGSSPFFLSVRDCARIIGIERLETASAFLNGLVSDGILTVKQMGTPGGRRATRYRYMPPASG